MEAYNISYQNWVIENRKRKFSIIYSSLISKDGRYYLCGDNYGRVHIWILSNYFNFEYWENDLNQKPKPNFSFQAHDNSIFSLIFYNDDNLLMSGGETEIKVWNWSDIVDSVEKNELDKYTDDESQDIKNLTYVFTDFKPNCIFTNPQISGIKGSLNPLTETFDFKIDTNGNLCSAGGDNNVHVWDIENEKEYLNLEGHLSKITSLTMTKNNNSPFHNSLFSGSEDGTIRIWDLREGKTTHMINPSSCKISTLNDNNSANNNEKQPSLNAHQSYGVTCLDIDENNEWLVCGSGKKSKKGFLTLFYLDNLFPVHAYPTSSSPQFCKFNQNKILSLGNENCIHHWNKSGKLSMKVQTTIDSCFSLAIDNENYNDLMIVNGSSCNINVFTNVNDTHCSFSLSI